MLDVLVGILALLIGGLFCFAGNTAMRVVFPFWGFFVGFMSGAGLVAAVSGETFFSTLMSWFVGFAVGILFGICAYLFYSVAVVLAFGSLGFTLTGAFLTAIGADWNWLIVLIGTVVAVMFAIAAVVMNAPALLLIVATAAVGAAVMVKGIMLIFNVVDLESFSSTTIVTLIRDSWWWFLVWLGFAVMGGTGQATIYRKEVETMKELWDQSAYPEDVLGVLVEPKK